jgi:hypothetical protein
VPRSSFSIHPSIFLAKSSSHHQPTIHSPLRHLTSSSESLRSHQSLSASSDATTIYQVKVLLPTRLFYDREVPFSSVANPAFYQTTTTSSLHGFVTNLHSPGTLSGVLTTGPSPDLPDPPTNSWNRVHKAVVRQVSGRNLTILGPHSVLY